MEKDEPKVIPFLNPIDPDAPAIDAELSIDMLSPSEGGLKQPLDLPSPSLLFRVPKSDPVKGYTAVVESSQKLDRLVPGSAVQALVTFIGVPKAKVWEGRIFALWHGRDVGTARIVKLVTS
jgi:hypothetical protein